MIMDKEELLKQYYNERFKWPTMPDFEQLTNDRKKAIEGTMDFAFFNLNVAMKGLGNAFLESLGIRK